MESLKSVSSLEIPTNRIFYDTKTSVLSLEIFSVSPVLWLPVFWDCGLYRSVKPSTPDAPAGGRKVARHGDSTPDLSSRSKGPKVRDSDAYEELPEIMLNPFTTISWVARILSAPYLQRHVPRPAPPSENPLTARRKPEDAKGGISSPIDQGLSGTDR